MGEERDRRKEQLRWCFSNLPGSDGRKATSRHAAEWMAANGGPDVSEKHLTNVRSGFRGANHDLLLGLARYFAIPPAFWDDLNVEEAVRRDVAKIDGLAASWRTGLIETLSSLDSEDLKNIETELQRLRDQQA